MTYNEWRDELKNNLLSVTESERRRVLDYYAEAYADRREAGFSEREIIDDFGAPYDAAQRILCDTDSYYEEQESQSSDKRDRDKRRSCDREARRHERERERDRKSDDEYEAQPTPVQPVHNSKSHDDYTWIFVLLCIIFAVPLFALVMAMVGVTVGICVAPFAMLVSGIATVGAGIGAMFHDFAEGLMSVGGGLFVVGLSIVLIPLCIQLVKWMWKLFKMFFRWIRSLFSGKKECRQ